MEIYKYTIFFKKAYVPQQTTMGEGVPQAAFSNKKLLGFAVCHILFAFVLYLLRTIQLF